MLSHNYQSQCFIRRNRTGLDGGSEQEGGGRDATVTTRDAVCTALSVE